MRDLFRGQGKSENFLFSGESRRPGDGDIMQLTLGDQIRFAEALIDPPKPGARWKRAAGQYAELVEGR
jgi:hypothetical protein